MRWTKINNAVYMANSSVVCVSDADMHILKDNINASPDQRIRLCAHQQADERLHEMLIAVSNTSYVRPHKHKNKSESFHVIEGLLDVILFDDNGCITRVIPMGNFASGKSFFYRLSTTQFHTIMVKTDIAIFHETTPGPFIKEETTYPDWAPAPEENHLIKPYLTHLANQVSVYQRNAI